MDLEEKRKFNIRLYPIYKMFAWDLLFYYAISFLFLTEVKGFSSADVVLLDVSAYTLFKCISQLPATIITDKLGKRMSVIMGNVFVAFSILFIMLCRSLVSLAIAEFCMAFGFVIKSIAEPNILYDAFSDPKSSGKSFNKLDGRGSALYYFLNAISLLATGFLYAVNPYLPVLLCLMFCVIATFMSGMFYSLRTSDRNKKDVSPKVIYRLKQYGKELRFAFKHILKSKRLVYLILFYGLFQSLIAVTTTLDRSLLTDLSVPPSYLGIIFAALSVLSSVSSSITNILHQKLRNKALTIFSIFFIGACYVSGLFILINLPFTISIILVLLSFGIRASIKGPFYTLYKKYLSSFASSEVRIKIYTTTYLFENIVGAAIAFAVSRFLSVHTTSEAFVALGVAYTIVFIILLYKMKFHVGLKPEEYEKNDINLVELK